MKKNEKLTVKGALKEIECIEAIKRLDDVHELHQHFESCFRDVLAGGDSSNDFMEKQIQLVNCAAMMLASTLAFHLPLWPERLREELVDTVLTTIKDYTRKSATSGIREYLEKDDK